MTALLLLSGLFAVQPKPPTLPPPPSIPPALAFASIVNGSIQIKKHYTLPEQRRVMLPKTTADGKTVEVPTLVIEPTPYIETKVIPLAEAKATDPSGKPIPTAKLSELLKTTTVVVLVPGAKLDAPYRKAFRDDIVVLSVPPERLPIK